MEKYLNIWREIRRIWGDFISAPNFKSAFAWGIALYAIALFAVSYTHLTLPTKRIV